MPKRGRASTRARSEAADSVRGVETGEGELDIPSGYESPPTEADEDDDGDFEIDAIKRAVYKDSRSEGESGWLGWHYTVMWARYLKSGSDSDIAGDNFDGVGTILSDFWKTYKKPLERGKKEPKGEIGDRHEPTSALIKKWFVDTKPKRSFDAYQRRRKGSGKRVLKADSDYYINQARKKLAAKRRSTQSTTKSPTVTRASRNPTGAAEDAEVRRKSNRSVKISSTDKLMNAVTRIADQTPSPTSSRASTPLTPFKTPAKTQTTAGGPSRARSSSTEALDALNSDHEVDAALGEDEDRESPAATQQSDAPPARAQGKGKRKRISSPSPAPAAASSRTTSARKKVVEADEMQISKSGKSSREESRGSDTVKKGKSKADNPLEEVRQADDKDIDDDDDHRPIKRPPPAKFSTRRERLAAMHITKLPAQPDVIDATASNYSSAHSETFGSPQAGIFDARQLAEPEPLDGQGGSVERVDDLFAEDDDSEEPVVPLVANRSGRRSQPSVTAAATSSSTSRPMSTGSTAAIAARSAARPSELVKDSPLPSSSTKHRAGQAAQSRTGDTAVPSAAAPTASTSTSSPRSARQASSAAEPEKYRQPNRMKTMEDLADPEQARARGRKGQPALQRSLPTGEVHIPLALRAAFAARSAAVPTSSSSANPGSLSEPTGTARAPVAAYQPRAPPANGSSRSNAPLTLASRGDPSGLPARNATPYVAPVDASRVERLQTSSSPELPNHSLLKSSSQPPLYQYPSPNSPPRDPPPSAPSRVRAPTRPAMPTIPPILSTSQMRALEASSSKEHSAIASCRISAGVTADKLAVTCDVRLLRGSPSHAVDDLSLQGLLGRSKEPRFFCETVDAFCLNRHVADCGSVVLEWAKVVCGNEELRDDYEIILGQVSSNPPKIFATYFESSPLKVDRHYALVFGAARHLDLDKWDLDRGAWQSWEVGMVALLVSLPLDWPMPSLPNPVDPEVDVSPARSLAVAADTMALLSSYSLTKHLVAARRKSVHYPPEIKDVPPSDLSLAVRNGFQLAGAISNHEEIDVYVVENARLGVAAIPLLPSGSIPNRTTILTVGPSLSLLPSQWKARHAWSHGGLVTFSPTFLLRHPGTFSGIMRHIRTNRNWVAYVIPPVLQWADESFNTPDRCPNAVEAFSSITDSMLLDKDIARLSGDAVTSVGGLAVSISPPSFLQEADCLSWISWFTLLKETTTFEEVLQLCRGVQPGRFDTLLPAVHGEKAGHYPYLRVQDVETSQLEDMVEMRMRPDIKYRRYLYIGDPSFDKKSREKWTRQGIEFVDPSHFAKIIAEGP